MFKLVYHITPVAEGLAFDTYNRLTVGGFLSLLLVQVELS